MHDLTFRCSDEDSSASFEGGELIHKVEEEQFVEGQFAECGQSINFFHEILMFELVFGVPFNPIVE
jgi:hypothetical protein